MDFSDYWLLDFLFAASETSALRRLINSPKLDTGKGGGQRISAMTI